MAKTAKEVIKRAGKVIKKQKDWFLREYADGKGMPDEATTILEDIMKKKISEKDLVLFEMLVRQLSKLERDQYWEQIRLGYGKLEKVMTELLNLPFFNQPERAKIKNELIEQTNIVVSLKGLGLKESGKKLNSIVKGKKFSQISLDDWGKIVSYTKELVEEIQGAVVAMDKIKSIIEDAIGVKI